MKLLPAVYLAIISLVGPVRADITESPDHSMLWTGLGSFRVIDSFAVVTSDFGVASLKMNQATGQFDPVDHLLLDTPPYGAEVAGDIAVVRSIADITYFVDLSQLPELILLGEVDLGESVYDLAIRGDDLYLACGFQGVRHYRLTDYAAPEFVDSSLAPIHCIQVDIVGSALTALDDYNGVLRYDLDLGGIGAPEDFLYIPRRARSFFSFGDTLVLPLTDQPVLYRGIFGPSGGELLDSVSLSFAPDAVFAVDTLIVSVATDKGHMEVISTRSASRTRVVLNRTHGLEPLGDTYFWQGSAHLALISGYHGLASFDLSNLWFDDAPRQVYARPGPITSLGFHNDRLVTGGERNPLESYRIDPSGAPVFDTALYGLNNVGAVVDAGEALIAHFPALGLISTLRFSGDSIRTLGSLGASQQPTTRLKYFDYPLVDSLSMLLSINFRSVDIIRVTSGWQMTRVSSASTLEEILDAIVLDSFLVVTTTDRQVHCFRIFTTFTNSIWWSASTPTAIHHLVETGPREADDGSWWFPSITLGFDGTEMYELYLRTDGFPVVLRITTLPVEVTATALAGEVLYTLGPQGIGRLALSSFTPVMDAYGGFGGHLAAYGDSTLAISDGTAVHLYSFKNIFSTAPVGETAATATDRYLRPNYPNPFNPLTRIDFYAPQSMRVELAVYNLLGRKVVTLVDGQVAVGLNTVEWDGTDGDGHSVATGVYFYRLTTPTGSETRKMVLLK